MKQVNKNIGMLYVNVIMIFHVKIYGNVNVTIVLLYLYQLPINLQLGKQIFRLFLNYK